jgi:hypothetical protein
MEPSSLNHELLFVHYIFTPIYMYGAPILLHIFISHVFYGFDVTPPCALAARVARPIISFHICFCFDFSRNIIQFCLLHKHTRILLFSSVSKLHFLVDSSFREPRRAPCYHFAKKKKINTVDTLQKPITEHYS